MKKWLLITLLMMVSALQGLDSDPNDASGTLIVTYQTGQQGERLDRIRFLIKDAHYQQQMYPKGSAYVDDDLCNMRMVVIEDLPRGDYTLEFIIPNSDEMFEEVPIRRFSVTQDEVIKIDQVIKLRYSSVQAIAQVHAEAPPFTILPKITLKSESSEFTPQTDEGKLNATHLVPGNYTIVFHELQGYQTPAAIKLKLAPGELAGPYVGIYAR